MSSLGQAQMFSNNNKRTQLLNQASGMRTAKKAAPTAPPNVNEIPPKLKMEALEIAVGAMSERLGDLAEQMETGDGANATAASVTVLQSQVAAIEERLRDLQAEVSSWERSVESRLEEVCAGQAMAADAGTASMEPEINAMLAVATQTVRATVASSGTWAYINVTGDPNMDITNDPESKVALTPGRHVRLVFPQHEGPDESIYMGAVWINGHTMEVSTGWVCLRSTPGESPLLCDFDV